MYVTIARNKYRFFTRKMKIISGVLYKKRWISILSAAVLVVVYFCINQTRRTIVESVPDYNTFYQPPAEAGVRLMGRDYQNFYQPPTEAGVRLTGRDFSPNHSFQNISDIQIHNFIVLTPEIVQDFVFIMAASENHFLESLDAVASAQHHMPGHKIFYYDLGLKGEQIREVTKMCDVEYRVFNFSLYPRHIRQLESKAWKSLVISQMIQEFPAVVWMDCSVRYNSSISRLYSQILINDGVLMFHQSSHNNFPVTHPSTYQYFPTDVNRQTTTRNYESGSLFLARTERLYRNVIYFWILCALDKDCSDPEGATLKCSFDNNYTGRYAGCHRYDQAVFNILVSNLFGYNYTAYGQELPIVDIHRRPTKLFHLQMCHNN